MNAQSDTACRSCCFYPLILTTVGVQAWPVSQQHNTLLAVQNWRFVDRSHVKSSVNDESNHSITIDQDMLNSRNKHWLTSIMHGAVVHKVALAV